MRDPERTIVCDILANGALLPDPNRRRYGSNVNNDGDILDKLHTWFENYCEGNEEVDLWMAFLKAERTLRLQRAGEQE